MNKLMMAVTCALCLVEAARAVEAAEDTGMQDVLKVQAAPLPSVPEARTAKEKVEQQLDKTFGKIKWRIRSGKRKITVADVSWNMENPVSEKDLFAIRETLAQRALMQAKVQLAEAMGVDVDAGQDVDVKPGDTLTTTFTSAIKLATTKPKTVFGATVLTQAESFQDGVYHLATAVAWSPKLQRAAVAYLAPEKASAADADRNATELDEWIAKQDFTTMCGPRQFVARDGERFFIGIAAREIGSNAEASAVNVRLAQMYAVQSLLFSLYGDVSFADAASDVATQITAGGVNGMTQGSVIETLTRNIAIRARKVLRGLDSVYENDLVHPVTGRKMHVSVYALSASKAAAAKALSTDIAACRARVATADTAECAYDEGLSDAVSAAAADRTAAEKAHREAMEAVDLRANPAKPLPTAGDREGDSPVGESVHKPKPGKPASGVYGGKEAIDPSIL